MHLLTDDPWLALGGVGPRGRRIFFLTSTRWLPMYENQNPATISRQKCYQMYLWLFQTSKMNFLLNDAFFYWSVPKVVYWWVEKHITRSASGRWCLQSYDQKAKNCQKEPKLPHSQYGTHFEEDYIPMTNLTIFSHYDLLRKLIQTLVPHIRGHHLITLQASMSGDWSCDMFFYSSIHNFWHTSVKKCIIQ